MTVEGGASIVYAMARPAPIRYLCVADDHLRHGLTVPDEQGHFIPATHVFALRHEALLRRFGDGVRDYGAAKTQTS